MLSKRKKLSFETIEDAELGTLTFADYGDTASYSCKLTLPVSSEKVDVFFETTSKEHRPTDKQKQFFKSVLDNYNSLVKKIAPVVSAAINETDYKDKKIGKSQLQLVSLMVPQVDTEEFNWDITFKATSLKKVFIIVCMDRLTPLSSMIEKDERQPFTKLLLRLLNGSS